MNTSIQKPIIWSITVVAITVLCLFFISVYDVHAIESSSPTITIHGKNPLIVPAGEKYVDPGISAVDTEDGVLPVVDTTKEFNTSHPGRYAVSYVAQDSDGNPTFAHRIVIIQSPKEYYGKVVHVEKVNKNHIQVSYTNGEQNIFTLPVKKVNNIRFVKNRTKILFRSQKKRVHRIDAYTGK